VVTVLTSINDANQATVLTERLELDESIDDGGASDLHHQQLMRYICEMYATHINFSPLEDAHSFGSSEWSPMQGLEIHTGDDDSSTISDF